MQDMGGKMVELMGIEPTLSKRELDFESSAY